MVRQENHESVRWEPLPPGSLNAFAKRMRSRRRQQKTARVAVPAAAMVILALLVPQLASTSPDTQPRFGGITCSEVSANLESFMAKDLDERQIAAIEAHLNECSECRQKMEAMLEAAILEGGAVAIQIPSSKTFVIGSLPHSRVLVAAVE